ncbi:calcium-binding protein, partial [Kiloniella laminariae]
SGTSGNNTIDLSNTTLTNVARIEGGAGNDSITGSAGDDTIVGGTGNDNLRGGDGNDTFLVEGNGQGADRYNGGAGRDKIQGTDGDQTVVVSHLTAGDSIEEIDLGSGTNVLSGTSGNNTIDLSNTTLTNVARIEGGAGNDSITGSAGDDTIVGGTGNDNLRGGDGNDTFIVEGQDQGADRFSGGAGTDRILGGDGDDTITVSHLTRGDSIEQIDGGAGVNILSGTSGNNTIDLSNTTLTNIGRIDAGAGNDTLIGSDDDDILLGGLGNDRLTGGGGDDSFTFSLSMNASGNIEAQGKDTIMDFDSGDRLVFEDILGDLGGAADPLAALDSLGGVTVVDGGAGRDVSIQFENGDSITLRGLGTADHSLDSLTDLNDNGIHIDVF